MSKILFDCFNREQGIEKGIEIGRKKLLLKFWYGNSKSISITTIYSFISVTSMFLSSYYQSTLVAILFYISLICLFMDEAAAIITGTIASAITNLYTLPIALFGISEGYKIITILLIIRYAFNILLLGKYEVHELFVVIIIAIVNFFTIFGAPDKAAGIYFFMYLMLNLLGFLVLSESKVNFDELKIDFEVIVSWVLTLLLLVSILDGKFSGSLTTLTIKEGINKNGFAAGVGIYGIICLCGILKENNKWKITAIWGYCVGLLFVVYSGSRATLLMIVGVSALYLFYLVARLLGIKQRGIFVSLILLMVIFTVAMICIIPQLRQRFDVSLLISTGGENRFLAWTNFFKYVIPHNLFFGIGLSGINEIAALQIWGNGLPNIESHNIIVAILLQTGIIGLTTYMIFFAYTFYKQYSRLKFSHGIIMPLLLLIGLFINGIGEVVFLEPFFWYVIGLGIGYANFQKRSEKLVDSKKLSRKSLLQIKI